MSKRPALPALITAVIAVALFIVTLVVGNKPNLGLDLQGGVSVVLKPVSKDNANKSVPKEALEQTREIISKRVNGIGVGEPDITIQGSNIVVQLPGIKDQKQAVELVGQTAELRFRPVLQQVGQTLSAAQRADAEKRQGELRTELKLPEGVTAQQVEDDERKARGKPTRAEEAAAAAAAQQQLANSQPGAGTNPTTGQPVDPASVTAPVTIPVVTVAPTVPSGAGTGGGRSLKGLHQTIPTSIPAPPTTVAPTTAAPTTTTTIDPAPKNQYGITVYANPQAQLDAKFAELLGIEQALIAAQTQTTPLDQDDPTKEVTLPSREGGVDANGKQTGAPIYKLGPSLLTGSAIEDATAGINSSKWEVRPIFREGPNGIDLFNAAAQKCNSRDATICPTQQLAVVLDGIVLTAPTIQEPSFKRDSIQISGSFKEQEAKDVAVALRYGSLPLVLEQQQVQTVSATLGKGALKAGLIAGGVGLALVALYIVLYYRILGLVTLGSLVLSSMTMWTIIGFFGVTQGLTLTLSGVVGIIVSVGVSLDSSVVFYENLKEDVRNGKTLRTSVTRSFDSAYRTIVKADISSLIGAVILYLLSVGPVKGFAFFLGLSTILDMLFAYFFIRPSVKALGLSRLGARPALFGIPIDDAPRIAAAPPAVSTSTATTTVLLEESTS